MTNYDQLIGEIYSEMAKVSFNSLVMIDAQNIIHTFGTDSKIIGRLFEMFTEPILAKVAHKYSYELETPKAQNVYPDFTFIDPESPNKKIAIDVKTTYQKTQNSQIKFTLGSYGSYMRNNTKNIQYPYTDYIKHYVIGFVYMRNDRAQESSVFKYKDKDKIIVPYYGVKYFVQEKYKIAGEKPGSGNTENIGTFPTNNIKLLREGKGPFAELGPEAFDLYWKYYPKYRSVGENQYRTLQEFKNWLPNQKSLAPLYSIDLKKIYNELCKQL